MDGVGVVGGRVVGVIDCVLKCLRQNCVTFTSNLRHIDDNSKTIVSPDRHKFESPQKICKPRVIFVVLPGLYGALEISCVRLDVTHVTTRVVFPPKCDDSVIGCCYDPPVS